jgi:hypothetical protein
LGPEGTGPAPHFTSRWVWGCSVYWAGCLLSLGGAGTVRHTSLCFRFSHLVWVFGFGGGVGGVRGCLGGRGVFVNWIVDASI